MGEMIPSRSGGAGSSRPEPTDDAFLGGRVSIRQPSRGYRAGIDAVLLAAAVPAAAGDSILEAGAGVGVPTLCLAERVPDTRLIAVEFQSELCDLGRENAGRNGFAGRVIFVEADILASGSGFAGLGLARDTHDHVLANPPFHISGRARAPGNPGKARAHVQDAGDLERWVRFMVTMAAADASVTIVHRAGALSRLLAALDRRVGDIAVLPVHSRAGDEASRVLVQGRKGSRAPLRIRPGLVMHDAEGGFTPPAERILRDGSGLDLR